MWYEKDVLRFLDKLDLREGGELRGLIPPKEFQDLLREIDVEAKEDIGGVLRKARERWKRWF